MSWNLDAKPKMEFKKIYLPEMEDGAPLVYTGVIQNISDVYNEKKFNSEERVEKIRIEVGVVSKGDLIDHTVCLFPTFVVSKGSGSYSSSKLYEILETAELLGEAKKVANESKEVQIAFLRKALIGMRCKFLVKTVRKDDKETRYTVLEKFTKIWKA